jgi:hypothetical protein
MHGEIDHQLERPGPDEGFCIPDNFDWPEYTHLDLMVIDTKRNGRRPDMRRRSRRSRIVRFTVHRRGHRSIVVLGRDGHELIHSLEEIGDEWLRDDRGAFW